MMEPIVKKVEPMFSEIRRMTAMENVTIIGIDHIPASNRVSKAGRKFLLQFEAVLNTGLNEIVKFPSLGRFTIMANGHCFVVEENQAYFEGFHYLDPDKQTFTLNISTLKDTNEREGYMRLALPITKDYWLHSSLRTYAFRTEGRIARGLMILQLDDGEVHVYGIIDSRTMQSYLIIEPQFVVTKKTLFSIHYAVATGLGIITGTAVFGEAYLLVSQEPYFESYQAISYYSLRDSVHSQYTTFTTNMHWVQMTLKRGKHNGYALDMIVDKDGKVKDGLVDWLYTETYGKIIANMYKYPEFARAAIILIDGTNKALDYQAAMYAVALETLCTKLKDVLGLSFDGIIRAKDSWKKIRESMTDNFRKICKELEIDENITDRIANKIPNLNNISNKDKFMLVLNELGLKRSESDNNALKQRNNLLHGELAEKTAKDDSDFVNMFYYSLVLHRLCTAIIFKFAGYHGYLVNNAVLMDVKLACDSREPALIEV